MTGFEDSLGRVTPPFMSKSHARRPIRTMTFRGRVPSLLVAFAFVLAAVQPLFLGQAAAHGPQHGDFFTYTFYREVTNGQGAYEEYYDRTNSEGQYEILTGNETHVRFRARYHWTYYSNEGSDDSGIEDRTVDFALATRRYVTNRTDLDEYDSIDGRQLAVWFWISPDVRLGDDLQILDDTFVVTSLDSYVWSNWVPRRGIEIQAKGHGSRNDDYGQFDCTYTDTYYFDRQTGYVIAERYRERDQGYWQSDSAAFDLREDFDVAASSNPISVDLLILGAMWSAVVLVIAGTVVFGYGIRWRTIVVSKSKQVPYPVKIKRIRRFGDFPHLPNEACIEMAPFLEDFARKAILAKDRAAVAIAHGAIVGFAVYGREADIGTILCKNTAVTETLRAYLGMKDFFSESRHEVPEEIRKQAASDGIKMTSPYAYNVFETHSVLWARLMDSPGFTWDTDLVTPMKVEDLPEVAALAKRVYKYRAARWLRAQFTSGDIGFVARIDGRIVGFAFATLVDGHGRVHTLTVAPESRGMGVGKELMRARLESLRTLGAADVVAEIADWNLPSLQIAWTHGFRPSGRMWVETSRTTRIKKEVVRR